MSLDCGCIPEDKNHANIKESLRQRMKNDSRENWNANNKKTSDSVPALESSFSFGLSCVLRVVYRSWCYIGSTEFLCLLFIKKRKRVFQPK
jgi:hypothetical protein